MQAICASIMISRFGMRRTLFRALYLYTELLVLAKNLYSAFVASSSVAYNEYGWDFGANEKE